MGEGSLHTRCRTALRRRRLAGDARAGEYVRAGVRGSVRGYLRRNWLTFAAATVAVCGIIIAVSFMAPSDLVQGLVIGGGVTAWLAAVWYVVVATTGAVPRMMGADGEVWTATELRRLRQQGWLLVNDVVLSHGNIDHVLVGPGGLMAVESKWSATTWTAPWQRDAVARAAKQASKNARQLRLYLQTRVKGVDACRPVVVLWGAGTSGDDAVVDISTCGDVDVTTGHSLYAWARGLPDVGLTRAQIEAVWTELASLCDSTDERRSSEALPAGPAAVVTRWCGLALAYGLGLTMGLLFGRHLDEPAWWAGATIAVGVLLLARRRWARGRQVVEWCLAGLASVAVLLLIGTTLAMIAW